MTDDNELEDLDEEPIEDDDEDEKCIICGGGLDEQLTCDTCVADLSEEQVTEALEKVIEDVHVIEILYSIPGVYELVKEWYNNEALDRAYEDLVERYETQQPAE